MNAHQQRLAPPPLHVLTIISGLFMTHKGGTQQHFVTMSNFLYPDRQQILSMSGQKLQEFCQIQYFSSGNPGKQFAYF